MPRIAPSLFLVAILISPISNSSLAQPQSYRHQIIEDQIRECYESGGKVVGNSCVLPPAKQRPRPATTPIQIDLKCAWPTRIWVAYADPKGRQTVAGPMAFEPTFKNSSSGRYLGLVVHTLRTAKQGELAASPDHPVSLFVEVQTERGALAFEGDTAVPGAPLAGGRRVLFNAFPAGDAGGSVRYDRHAGGRSVNYYASPITANYFFVRCK